LTPVQRTARRLAVAWGVHPVVSADATDVNDMVEKACRAALEQEFAKPGQRLVIAAGMPFGTPGATNLLRIAWIADEGGWR
jgi:pyruvate kinase